MPETRYLQLGDVIALHALVMERTGQQPAPLRDMARLEAAILRPQMAAHNEQADTISQAVLLAVGISQSQAFLDGNKRTALVAMDVFLRLNGWRFRGDSVGLAKHLERIAGAENNREEAIAAFDVWLREHLEPLP